MLFAMECAGDEEGFSRRVQKYFVPADIADSVKEEVQAVSRRENILEFEQWIDANDQSSGLRQDEEIREIINTWKGEYIRLCQI
jgi:hypothetical protein